MDTNIEEQRYEQHEREVYSNQHFERACQHIRNKLAQQIHEMRMLMDNRNVTQESRLASNECLDEMADLLELSFPAPEPETKNPKRRRRDKATKVKGKPTFNRLSKKQLSAELS